MIPRLLTSWVLSIALVCAGYGQHKSSRAEQRADRYFTQGYYQKSSELYARVVEKHPRNESAQLKLARSFFELGLMNQADSLYALVIHKRYLVTSKDYLNYARALQGNNKDQLAQQWAYKYLEYHPRDAVAQNIVYQVNTSSSNANQPTISTTVVDHTNQINGIEIEQHKTLTKATLLKLEGLGQPKSYVLSDYRIIEVKESAGNPTNWLQLLLEENNIQLERTVRIAPIYYGQNQTAIDPLFFQQLNELAELMIEYEFLQFEIGAYSDSTGTELYNQALSDKRAAAVLLYLNKLGIKSERFFTMGYGEFKTINKTSGYNPTNKEYNDDRRTEFRLIYMDDNQVVSNY